MPKKKSAFEELKDFSLEIKTYSGVSNLLQWDQETYMPPGGITARGQQLSLLSGHVHELKTSKKYRKLLGQLISSLHPASQKKGTVPFRASRLEGMA